MGVWRMPPSSFGISPRPQEGGEGAGYGAKTLNVDRGARLLTRNRLVEAPVVARMDLAVLGPVSSTGQRSLDAGQRLLDAGQRTLVTGGSDGLVGGVGADGSFGFEAGELPGVEPEVVAEDLLGVLTEEWGGRHFHA